MNLTEEEKSEITEKVSFSFEKLNEFLDSNETFIDSKEVSTVFSLGVLVSLVFSMQQANLGNTPFEKKLKGLELTSNDLQRIFTESLTKINQYSSIYTYKELREFIAANLTTRAKTISHMTSQEISFYFVSGLELGRIFKSKK